MLADSPFLRRSAMWLLVAALFVAVAAAADLLGDALSAVIASTVFGI